MSLRPPRDVRLHDPHHPLIHPPHLNGAAVPSTPSTALVSPAPVPSTVPPGAPAPPSILHKLALANEQTWLVIGRVAEQMGDLDHALSAYESALRHNPMSLSGLTQVAGIARIKENYPKAVEYFQRVLALQEENGEVWSALGHCYLMQDDLQKAYSAYQQALYLLPNPKEDPKLWYGIGILYDRYGSLDHAEEAFSSVLRMDKELDFDKANEILFRLGIIYKQQGKYEDSLNCFDRILRSPPSPLAHADIWFQIGHVYEQQKNHVSAKDAYERVVADNPGHAKVLQQLGWLYHQDGSSFQNQDLAIQYLTKSLEADPSDAQSWYLLGRAYMAGQKYNKAYEAYQQAVYRDGRNPTFWCSIGVLYFQINQFRDALDAYSRAIRINPYISEVWFDLGSLYESCNNQISDAIDAYARASELDPSNPVISQRLQLLKNAQATGNPLPAAPGPQDVHPTAYASAVVPPNGLPGAPLMLQTSSSRPIFRTESRGEAHPSLPPPSQVGAGRSSPGPFRGGPPPPVILDETRHVLSHTPLAPMDVDRPPLAPRDYPGSLREPQSRGPAGHQTLLLHQPIPQQQLPPAEDLRNGAHAHHQDSPFFARAAPRASSRSISPRPRGRSPPPPPFQSYPPPARQQMGPAQPSAVPSQHSPRTYTHEQSREPELWERRPAPQEHREWERRPRDYPPPPSQVPPQQQPPFYASRSPAPSAHSPPSRSPRAAHPPRGYWEAKPAPPAHASPAHASPAHASPPGGPHGGRYDARYDAREHREYEREREEPRAYAQSPEVRASRNPPPPHVVGSNIAARSESPLPAAGEAKERRRRAAKDKDDASTSGQEPAPKRERKKRAPAKRPKEEPARTETETPKPFGPERPPPGVPGGYKIVHGYGKGSGSGGSPEPVSSNGSGSSRSVQPSPISATPHPPSRVVDEDYDEGVADALMGLAAYRPPEAGGPTPNPTHSPTSGSRHTPRPSASHRGSISSTRSRPSPPSQAASLKRALSPAPDDSADNKRTRLDAVKRRASSQSGGRRTPLPSTRPSPIPFRTQPASHSPEARQPLDPYPASPQLPAVFPPHPRPIGAGLSLHSAASVPISLPPIATLSPAASTAASPGSVVGEREERMQVGSRSASPASRAKGGAGTAGTPKHTPSPAGSVHAAEKEAGS